MMAIQIILLSITGVSLVAGVPTTPYMFRYANKVEFLLGHVHSSFPGHPDYDSTSAITFENMERVTNGMINEAKFNGISIPINVPNYRLLQEVTNTNETQRNITMPEPIAEEALYPKGDGLLESFTRLARSKGMVIHASPFDTYETYEALDKFTSEQYAELIANFVELY